MESGNQVVTFFNVTWDFGIHDKSIIYHFVFLEVEVTIFG